MQGKYKKCSKGTKKIKKAELGIQDVNTGTGTALGSAAGAGLSLIPGVGGLASALATPLLGAAGNGIENLLNQDKLKAANKQLKITEGVAKANSGINTDLTSFQAKQYSKGGTTKTKVIEIEGKKTPEIHTDKNFNVKNLGTTPHSKGGDKVLAEEGDIVFPTQNSPKKYKEVMTAIMKKDKYKLKKEQAKLPEDNVPKKKEGDKNVKVKPDDMDFTPYKNALSSVSGVLNSTFGNWGDTYARNIQPEKGIDIPKEADYSGYSPLAPKPLNGAGWMGKPLTRNTKVAAPKVASKGKGAAKSKPVLNTSLIPKIGDSSNADLTGLEPEKDRNTYAKIDLPTAQKKETVLSGGKEEKKKGKGVDLNSAMELAPIAYNIGQGLFGKTEKVNRREFNPEMEKYVDTSANTRREINSGYKTNLANSRNLSGGLASNMRANSQAASNAKIQQMNSVDSQEYGKQLDVNNRNIGRTNEAKLTNLGLQNQYDDLDAQNRAKKSEALGQGLTELGALGSRNTLAKNNLQATEINAKALEAGRSYGNGFTTDGNQISDWNLSFNNNGAGIPANLKSDFGVNKNFKKAKGSKGIQVERKYKLK